MDEEKSKTDPAILAEQLMKLNSLIEEGNIKSVQEYLIQEKIREQTYEQLQTSYDGPDINTPIGVAASVGDVAMLDYLVDEGFNPGGSSFIDKNCPIHLACRAGKLASVQTLVQKHHVDINVVNEYRSFPLFIAAENGFLDVVKFLVENGSDQDFEIERSVLHIAASGSVDLCEYLISVGADVNAENLDGNSPLHLAYKGRNEDVARVLMEHGADVNYVNGFSNTPLSLALDDTDFEMFKIMCSKNPECLDDNGSTPLHLAVNLSLAEFVRHLVADVGVRLGIENEFCETPFSLAMENGNIAIAQMLIKAGLNPGQEECLLDEDRLTTMLDADGGAEFIQHVQHLAHNPRSLMDITCFRVRALLGRNLEQVETFPLPQNLKDVVLLKHVF